MADLEIEVIGNETAVATTVASSSLELEINIDSAVVVGSIPEPEVVEVSLTNPPILPDPNAVKNAGNAPALMVLNAADPVPPGTPAGTVILRKA